MLGSEALSSRQKDQNGFITIQKNPISRIGVFQYSGASLPGADPSRIYNVLRPEEELSDPEAIKSFQMIPLINDHVMLGEGYDTSAEQKGVHGSTGTDVTFENGILYSTLKIFSDALKSLIDSGKRGLSLGYRCRYEKSSGVFQGQAYDYIQRAIRGNHIALVAEGRMGPDIAVLDHFAFDHFDLALDKGEEKMEEEKKSEEKKEMTMAEVVAILEKIMPQIEALNAAVAGKAKDMEDDGVSTESEVLDEDKEEKKDDGKSGEKESMDSALRRIDSLERNSAKAILAEVSKRDRLAKEVAQVVGTFDHSEMTAGEVAAYAVKKIGISAPEGQEQAVLSGYLAGRKQSEVGFSLDTKEIKKEGLLAARLNKAKGE